MSRFDEADAPLVTIAIPLYNSHRFIRQTVESALRQTYANLEVLVLDDGSTDGSAEIVESIADSRLRLIRQPGNLGMARNYNSAIDHYRGDYLVWLSHDDELLPGHVESSLRYYRDHPDVDVHYCQLIFIDGDGRWYDSHQWLAYDGARSFAGRNEAANLLTRDCFVPIQTVLIHRRLIEEFGGMATDLETAIDWEYWVRLALAGKRFGFEAKPAALFRKHGDNASGDANYRSTGKALRDTLRIYIKHLTPENERFIAGYGGELRGFLGRSLGKLRQMATSEDADRIEREAADLFGRGLRAVDAVPRVGSATLAGRGLVSVVIPHSGRIEKLRRALASLAAQTYANWEAVVVCDGVPDPTSALQELSQDGRIRVVHTLTQGGPGMTRNIGLRQVNGEIVTYLDDDDQFAPGYLDAVRAAFADPGLELSVSRFRTLIASGYGDVLETSSYSFGALSPDADAVPLGAVAHRRSLPAETGYFREDLPVLEGWEFMLRLSAGRPVTRLDVDGYSVIVDVGAPLHPRQPTHHLYGRRDEQSWQMFFGVLNAIYGSVPASTPDAADRRAAYVSASSAAVAARLTTAKPSALETLGFVHALQGRL